MASRMLVIPPITRHTHTVVMLHGLYGKAQDIMASEKDMVKMQLVDMCDKALHALPNAKSLAAVESSLRAAYERGTRALGCQACAQHATGPSPAANEAAELVILLSPQCSLEVAVLDSCHKSGPATQAPHQGLLLAPRGEEHEAASQSVEALSASAELVDVDGSSSAGRQCPCARSSASATQRERASSLRVGGSRAPPTSSAR